MSRTNKLTNRSDDEDEAAELMRELETVSYTHLRAHETDSYLVCRLLLEKKKYAVFCLKKKNSFFFFFFLMIRRQPRSTHCISSAASDVYKRQEVGYKAHVEEPVATVEEAGTTEEDLDEMEKALLGLASEAEEEAEEEEDLDDVDKALLGLTEEEGSEGGMDLD